MVLGLPPFTFSLLPMIFIHTSVPKKGPLPACRDARIGGRTPLQPKPSTLALVQSLGPLTPVKTQPLLSPGPLLYLSSRRAVAWWQSWTLLSLQHGRCPGQWLASIQYCFQPHTQIFLHSLLSLCVSITDINFLFCCGFQMTNVEGCCCFAFD